jgi:HEAT repeat protein
MSKQNTEILKTVFYITLIVSALTAVILGQQYELYPHGFFQGPYSLGAYIIAAVVVFLVAAVMAGIMVQVLKYLLWPFLKTLPHQGTALGIDVNFSRKMDALEFKFTNTRIASEFSLLNGQGDHGHLSTLPSSFSPTRGMESKNRSEPGPLTPHGQILETTPSIQASDSSENQIISKGLPVISELIKAGDVEGLIDVLSNYRHKFPRMHEVIQALAELKDERAVEPLITLLQNPKERQNDQEDAAEALGKIGGTQAIEALVAVIQSQTVREPVRRSAEKQLCQVGDRRAVDLLIGTLMDRKNPSHIRGTAAHILGEIGDEQSIEPLVAAIEINEEKEKRISQLLSDKPWYEWKAAYHAENDWWLRTIAVGALEKVGDSRAVLPLAKLVKCSAGEASIALKALTKILENCLPVVTVDDLRELASLEDTVGVVWDALGDDDWVQSPSPMRLNCSPVRQMAHQELSRRGLQA